MTCKGGDRASEVSFVVRAEYGNVIPEVMSNRSACYSSVTTENSRKLTEQVPVYGRILAFDLGQDAH